MPGIVATSQRWRKNRIKIRTYEHDCGLNYNTQNIKQQHRESLKVTENDHLMMDNKLFGNQISFLSVQVIDVHYFKKYP